MGSKTVVAALFVLAAVSVPLTAGPRAGDIERVLGCSGDPCVVKNNPGGEVGAYKAAAREIKRTGRQVVIDGPCNSACAILADIARKQVCVTSRAKFGFHKGYVIGLHDGKAYLLGRFTPPQSRDIASWVTRNGGYPSKGMRVMRSAQAGKIWKRC